MEARGFCMTFSVAQVELPRASRILPVPLGTCSFKVSVSEGNGTHTCGTLDFLGVDQIPHCPSSVVLSVIFSCVCLSLWAMYHKQRCQSYLKLCWSPYRESSCTRTQPSLLRVCLPVMAINEDRHLIQVWELLFIQIGIISLRELSMISTSLSDFSYHLEL